MFLTLDTDKSIEQLENDVWGPPEYDGNLVRRCHELRKIKLCDLSIEDLRMLAGQNIGTEYIIPLAVEILKKDAYVKGDFYPGDLLYNVMTVRDDFWLDHPDLKTTVVKIFENNIQILENRREMELSRRLFYQAYDHLRSIMAA